ncbi:hypothetical protein NMG60_11036071 [Bertholletia excelsa]
MGFRTPHAFIIILWLSLFILLFHELYAFKYFKTTITANPSPPSHHSATHRKVLARKFDFTPFVNARHHTNHSWRTHGKAQPAEPAPDEIDPRYGVEKRLVPTGPNPLHH